MRTLLITGGAGFIGSNFIHYYLAKHRDCRLINLDKLTYAGNLENLQGIDGDPRYHFIHGDICDKDIVENIFRETEPEWAVNFAAESHVDRSIKEPETFIKTNVFGTFNLLNISKHHWGNVDGFKEHVKFLQVSTDEVYGSLGPTGFFTEETPLDPHSPYSASKAGADLLVKSYFDTYGMPVNITRCSNNYGPYQFPEKLIPLMINNAMEKKSLPIYGDGMNIRDWLYVEDHCQAIDMVLRYGTPGEVYNIGGHNERPNIQIVRTILAYLHEHVDQSIDEGLIKFVEDRKGHDRRYGIDPAKIRRELGWQPETTFEDGIIKTIRWYLDNKKWLNSVTSGEYQQYYRRMYGSN